MTIIAYDDYKYGGSFQILNIMVKHGAIVERFGLNIVTS